MNGVIGMTNILLRSNLTPDLRRYVETIRNSGETLLTIINDILDFSKIDAGKLDLKTIDFDLRDAIENAIEQLARSAHQKGLELHCMFSPEVPTQLRGDPDRLRQILTNLVGNAVKFTTTGEILVRISSDKNSSDEPDPVTVHIAVSDTGIGMSADSCTQLFQAFSQVDSSSTRKHGGTGLGLAISKQLAEMMEGQIGVDSEVGKGSTFWFTVRLSRQPSQLGHQYISLPKLPPLRVCVIDDNAASRGVLEQVLTSLGLRPIVTENGLKGLEILKASQDQGQPCDVAIDNADRPWTSSFQTTCRNDGGTDWR